MSCSDTDEEYKRLREIVNDFEESVGSEEESFSDQEPPYLEDISLEIPDLLDENVDLLELGTIHSVFDGIAVVATTHGAPILDLGTVVVLPDRSVFGVIGDTFGPVESPFYSVKVAPKYIEKVSENLPVLFCPSLSRQIHPNNLYTSESESDLENDLN